VRDRDSASYIATFEPAATFGDLVKAEGIRRGAGHVRQLTILGDGAAWIWNIAASTFPEATQIVDLFHAREHLHSLTRSLEFMLLDRKDEWLARPHGGPRLRRHRRHRGRSPRIPPPKREERRGRDGTRLLPEQRAPDALPLFRSRGLFVGSGVVESGCKAVIGQRLKLSGMRWTIAGADAITTLRCQQASRPKTASGPHVTTR